MRASLAVLFVLIAGDAGRAAPAAADCTTEATALDKEQSDLPQIEFARPADRPPYCITLETLMAFAARVKTHVAHCPASDYAPRAVEWEKKRTNYGKLFSQYRCKRTL
jgi:hypothetical protein